MTQWFALRNWNEIDLVLPSTNLTAIIASVTNKERGNLPNFSGRYNISFHSLQHVPLVEENPFEGYILGTKACLEAAIDSRLKHLFLYQQTKLLGPETLWEQPKIR